MMGNRERFLEQEGTEATEETWSKDFSVPSVASCSSPTRSQGYSIARVPSALSAIQAIQPLFHFFESFQNPVQFVTGCRRLGAAMLRLCRFLLVHLG
jgi:hypothetical protein